jgi:GntR family transcriptional regulator / MocR family aminotransferase
MIATSAARRASSLLVRVDMRSGETLQQQIYSGIRRAVLDGILAPGTRLPSSRELARDLGVSRTTTVAAIEQLIAEAYLVAQQGAGTFVAQELPDELPRARAVPDAAIRHPPLSVRGAALARITPPGVRVGGPPRAFRIGVPGLDLFPVRLWAQLVSRRARAVTLSQLDYSETAGVRALREAIAGHVTVARGTRCTADQVLVVAGAQRGLEQICRFLLDPGDTAWVEEPGYPGARSALISAGARIVPVPVDEEGLNVCGHGSDDGARLAYVTPSHQFPLGVPMNIARRYALLNRARAAGAWVIEDDYDSEFRYGAPPMPCLHGLDVDGRVIYIGSFSKTLFPALRLGFIITPPDLHERMVAARRADDVHPPTADQLVLAEFIGEGHFERHLRRMRSAYRERAESLVAAAERFCGGALHIRPVQTGLHAVADRRRGSRAGIPRGGDTRDRGDALVGLLHRAVSSECARARVRLRAAGGTDARHGTIGGRNRCRTVTRDRAGTSRGGFVRAGFSRPSDECSSPE